MFISTCGVHVPVVVAVDAPARRRSWWQRLVAAFVALTVVVGCYAALVQLQWAPMPPGPFPAAKTSIATPPAQASPVGDATQRPALRVCAAARSATRIQRPLMALLLRLFERS